MAYAADTCERGYRVRCNPTLPQQRLIAQLIGAKRFVWGWVPARRRDA